MADEKPRKTRKTTSRTPRKRSDGESTATAALAETRISDTDSRDAESPVLAIQQSSEVMRPASDDVDAIRRQAYELYLSRGAGDGNDLSDWLEAERIVRDRRGTVSP